MHVAKCDLTPELVRSFLSYDRETGHFTWVKRPGKRVSVGDIAGGLNRGYIHIAICGKQYRAHRLAWFVEHGHWPDGEIDHINGNRSDNRIANLRVVDGKTNTQNRRTPMKRNKLGVLGVYKSTWGRFVSSVHFNGRQVYLGTYSTPEEAHAAYVKAKRELHAGNTL